MDINYHYYTLKTLAHCAGIDDANAELIAHYSQQIDDFIMSSPILVFERPPDFFVENGLAYPCGSHWVFKPCPTGINVVTSCLYDTQLHTLMPFHFVMPDPKNLTKNDRALLRCKAANSEDNLYIKTYVEDALSSTNLQDRSSLIRFAMLLHTFADTFAHNNFSGFQGWENKASVARMDHENPSNCWLKRKLCKNSKKAMSPLAVAFYSALPPIGHGNAAHAPDYCDCDITLLMKDAEFGSFLPVVERDNADCFSECSKQIFKYLCYLNNRPYPGDDYFETLQKKLKDAQNSYTAKNREYRKRWQKAFKEIKYSYNKKRFFDIKLKILRKDKHIVSSCSKRALKNSYSSESDNLRTSCITLAKKVSGDFYLFNELAYRYVFNTVGDYASKSSFAEIKDYIDTIGNFEALKKYE